MNCKQGDLAVIVCSEAGNEGKIVQCIKFIPSMRWISKNGVRENLPSWEIDKPLTGHGGETSNHVADRLLRPLRNDPGQDITLTWKDVPSTDEVAA